MFYNFYYTCFIVNLLQLSVGDSVTISKSTEFSLNGFSMSDFIKSHGYPVEVHHNLQTKDGYLLDIHRIPYDRNNSKNRDNKGPILLIHCLHGSPEDYIVTGPKKALGFLLADRGYDVWIGSLRGTKHSKKHIKLSPDDFEFWDFSWHEMGVYDLPVFIDHILNVTRAKNLAYVGYSQGTTAFFVLMSMKPEYNKFVRIMAAFAPVAYMGKENSIVPQPQRSFLNQQYEGVRKTLKITEVTNNIYDVFCISPHTTSEVCSIMKGLVGAVGNLDVLNIDKEDLPLILQIYPDTASFKQMMHYTQSILSGNFSQYDYGRKNNLKLYKSVEPPVYDLTRITTPVGLFACKDDEMATIPNIERLSHKLQNVATFYIIPAERFGHAGFLAAKQIVELLYNTLFELLHEYE